MTSPIKKISIQSASELTGVFPAIFMPLKMDDPKRLNNSIDYDKAKKIIDDLIAEGVQGLVPVGTTGQSPTVSTAQHLDFIRFTADYVDGRVPIIAGAGSNCTRESVEMIQKIQNALGSMAVLCVTGYYNNPPQEGLISHYETLSRETGAKIVIYNVPARTASYLEAETILQLSRDPNIIGLKQAVDFKNPGKYREDTQRIGKEINPADMALFTGEDDAFYAILELGGQGIITAAGNIPEVSRQYLKLWKKYLAGEKSAAEQIQKDLEPLIKAVFLRKNPIPLGTFFNSPLYLPLVSVRETKGGEEAHQHIMQMIETAAPSLKKYH